MWSRTDVQPGFLKKKTKQHYENQTGFVCNLAVDRRARNHLAHRLLVEGHWCIIKASTRPRSPLAGHPAQTNVRKMLLKAASPVFIKAGH